MLKLILPAWQRRAEDQEEEKEKEKEQEQEQGQEQEQEKEQGQEQEKGRSINNALRHWRYLYISFYCMTQYFP